MARDPGVTAAGIAVTGTGAVRVVNGRISHWNQAVTPGPPNEQDPDESDGSVLVDQVSFTDNGSGVDNESPTFSDPDYARTVLVQRSRFTRNGTGVSAAWVRIDVETSTFTDNRLAADATTGHLGLRDSVFVGNDLAVNCDETHCALENDTLRDNTRGIEAAVSSVLDLSGSTITGSTVAISNSDYLGFGGVGDVTGNRFADNDTAVSMGFGSALTLTGNTFTRNGSAVTSDDPEPNDQTSATLTGNTFTRNGDAITLPFSVRLKDNSAVRNTGWGIYAPNAVDLGGNTAHGNGRSPQCTGVVCS